MSEAKDTSQGLDASVAALVGDNAAPTQPTESPIDFESLAAEAVADMMNSGAEPPSPAAPAPADPGLDEAVAELIAAPPPSQPATPSQEPADLAKAVEKLLEEEAAQAAQVAPPVPEKIETLDAKIANLADDLIAGELADEKNVLQGEVGVPPVKEAPPPPSGTDKPADQAPAPAPRVAEAAPVFEPPEPVTTTRAPAAPAARPPAPKQATSTRDTAEKAAKAAARHGARAALRLKPHGLKLLQLMSGPLQNRPKYMRDVVGWVAIITLFNASCLWMYVLFFRSAKAPAPVTTVVKAEESHDQAKDESSGHGEKKAEKKDDKKSSKTDKTKKPPPKKDAAKSHGGGH